MNRQKVRNVAPMQVNFMRTDPWPQAKFHGEKTEPHWLKVLAGAGFIVALVCVVVLPLLLGPKPL